MIETLFTLGLVTNTCVPDEFTATLVALATPGTVAITVLVVVSMTETLKLLMLPTYTRVPAGLIATPVGAAPTGTVAITELRAVSITETVFPEPPPLLVT